jgi:hypothetical protein
MCEYWLFRLKNECDIGDWARAGGWLKTQGKIRLVAEDVGELQTSL